MMMPTPDKLPRMITKLTSALADKDAEIAQLKRELAGERQRGDELGAQVSSSTAVHTRVLQRALTAERQVAELAESVATHAAKVRELSTLLETECSLSMSTTSAMIKAQTERDTLLAKLAEVEPQAALVEEQRAALTKILDGVRSRMRRRELEEERAVLNRKAVAGAVPARNFR